MQFHDLRIRSGNPRRFNCTGGHPKHPKKCLNRVEEFEINVSAFHGGIGRYKHKVRSIDDIFAYLEYACKLVPDKDEVRHLLYVDVCPVPLITFLSIELYQMYKFCGNSRFPYPGGYLDQLQIYIEASGIIAAEEQALAQKAIKSDGQKR